MSGRRVLRFLILFCLLAQSTLRGLAAPQAITFDAVRDMASDLARKPFATPSSDLPPRLARLDYDAYRAINYRRSQALWSGPEELFGLEFYHRGYLYKGRVEVNTVDSAGIRAVAFKPEDFDYRKGRPVGVSSNLGFAGFRLLYRWTPGGQMDEVTSFLGASYFRAVPAEGVFGASARGIAINTSAAGVPEEFPAFTRFWVIRSASGATGLILYALLDGPSIAGACQFEIRPGIETDMDIQLRLFVRKSAAKVGLAPLTSMFFYGENGTPDPTIRDRRPEIHDSDGLLVATGTGEWLWRPLDNPPHIRCTSFDAGNLCGFGLLQRDRDPVHYGDPGAALQKRPGIWVEPQGKWPAGRVELMELPSKQEGMDNIVAQFVLDPRPAAGTEIAAKYRLRFFSRDLLLHSGGRVVATRSQPLPAGGVQYSLDFDLGNEVNAAPRSSLLQPVLTAVSGTVDQVSISRLPEGLYRVTFRVRADGTQTVELRAFLRAGSQTLSETWSELWKP